MSKCIKLVVCAILVMILFPAAVLAEGEPVCVNTTTGTEYGTIAEALAGVSSGQTLKLLQDITYSAADTICINSTDITLNLNGYIFNLIVNSSIALDVYNSKISLTDATGSGEFNVTGTNGVSVNGSNAEVTVTNATATGSNGVGAMASDGALVTVEGQVTATGASSIGVKAESAGHVSVLGSVQSTSSIAAAASIGSTITVHGDCSGKYGIGANFGSEVHIYGNITVETKGVVASGAGSTVVIEGDCTSQESYAISSSNEAQVTIKGDVKSTNSSGPLAYDNGKIAIEGDVISYGKLAIGVTASSNGNLIVKGDVVVLGDGARGSFAETGGSIHIYGKLQSKYDGLTVQDTVSSIILEGNCTVSDGYGAIVSDNGKIEVSGIITASNYIMVDNETKSQGDYYTPTTKAGYRTYKNSSGPSSTVWVKYVPNVTSVWATPSTIGFLGGAVAVKITGDDLPDGIVVTAFLGASPTAITGVTSGTALTQTAILEYPTKSTAEAEAIHTIRISLDGGATWHQKTASVMAAKYPFTIVTFRLQDSGTLPFQQVRYNEPMTAPSVPPRTGYTLDGWYKDASYQTPWNFSADLVTEDTTLYARWKAAAYAITISSNNTGYGTISGGGSFAYGAAATVKAAPKAGYRFVRWLEGSTAVSTSDSYTFTVIKARTLQAEFAPISYAVAACANNTAYGAVTGGGSYAYGATATVMATPKAGYRFVCWLEGTAAVSTSVEYSFTVSKARTLAAEFAPISYAVVASANNTAYGTVTGGGSYAYGSAVTVKATPKAGYRFVRWLEGTTALSTSTEYSFTVSKARTLTAEFAKIGVPAVTATSAGYNSIKLSWNAIAGAKEYEVYRSISRSSGFTRIATTASTSYTSISLTTNMTYYFKVSAKCVATTATTYGSYSAVKSAKPVPAAPGSPKAVSAGYKSVKVSWSAVAGVTKYRVYRATNKTGVYIKIAETTATSYTYSGLTTGKTYYYKVLAYSTVGKTQVPGLYSAIVSAAPVPATPGKMKAVRASNTSVKVSWGKVSGATKYELYRSTSKTGSYSKVADTRSTSYTNIKLTHGKTYYYKVRAYRTVGGKKVYGNYSAIVSAKP